MACEPPRGCALADTRPQGPSDPSRGEAISGRGWIRTRGPHAWPSKREVGAPAVGAAGAALTQIATRLRCTRKPRTAQERAGRRMDMERYEEGLRCQDVHAGLHALDPNSPQLIPLERMRLVGMAASVAALVRGRDVIDNAEALKLIAASELDVSSMAFDRVIKTLADAGPWDRGAWWRNPLIQREHPLPPESLRPPRRRLARTPPHRD